MEGTASSAVGEEGEDASEQTGEENDDSDDPKDPGENDCGEAEERGFFSGRKRAGWCRVAHGDGHGPDKRWWLKVEKKDGTGMMGMG